MKSVFEVQIREEIISRIRALQAGQEPLWGSMTMYQMLKHCSLWEDMIFGKNKYKQVFLGKIFGKMALKGALKDERHLGKNSPTIPDLKIVGDGDIQLQKEEWISKIKAYENFPDHAIMHPFFGKMTKEQAGYFAYKHTDHHLRQFNR